MTTKRAIHNINQTQIKLRNYKNIMEQFTRYPPKNSEHAVKNAHFSPFNAAQIVTYLNNTQLKGLVELIAT